MPNCQVLLLVVVVMGMVNLNSTTRRGYITISPHNGGPWGSWGPFEFCPTNSYANAFEIKVERQQGGGDDTAMNGVRLYCNGTYKTITSTVQRWGTWRGYNRCTDSVLTGMQLQVEREQGDGDDTAANNLRMICKDYQRLESSRHNQGNWGDWSSWVNCPQGYAVCGIQTRVEEAIDGDDTALNSIRMACCNH